MYPYLKKRLDKFIFGQRKDIYLGTEGVCCMYMVSCQLVRSVSAFVVVFAG